MGVKVDDSNHFYEKIASITDQMLDAVKRSDWDKLSVLELYCAKCIDENSAEKTKKLLSEKALSAKVVSLKKILADDREIRHLLEPWMSEFALLINGKRNLPKDIVAGKLSASK